ncbi:nuclear pore complex protein Nup214-like [Saccoglossus kowalevskii]
MEQEFGPPERQVSEDVFRFKQLCKIKIFDNNVETLAPKDVVHLVAVSNKYGLTFVGVDSGFKVIKTSELSKLDIEQGSITTVSAVPVVRKVKLAVMPCHISLSADSLTLSVCFNDNTNTVVNCYDVRAFVNMAKDPLPFCSEILIPGNTAPLLDLKWNPDVAHASMFAACCNKGTLSLWDISNSTAAQLHCLDSDNGISAICWSPKGKQIVCGTLAGKLVQYSKTLEKKREISEPSVFDNNVVIQVVSVLWLSTYSFMTAYSVVGTTDQPSVVIVNAPKTGAVVYTNLEDVCYGSGEDRNQVYYFLNIPEWNLVLTAQGNALEVVVMGKQDVEPEWERWSLEDAARIEMPLANNEDTYPMGLALDLTSQQELVINDSLTLPPAPIFLVLTTEGLLCPYYVINRSKDIQSIVNPPEVLTYAGERLPSGMPKVTQPVVPASQQTTSTTDTTANQSALFHTPRGNLLSRFENETTPKVESMPTTTAPATTGFSFTPKLTSTTSTTSGTAATSAFTFSLSQTTKPTLFGGTPTSEQPQTTKPTLFGGTPTSEQPQTTKPTLFGGTPTSEQPPTIKPSVVTTAATTTSGAASSLFGTTPSFGQPQTTTPIAAPTTNSSNGAPTLFSSTGLFSQSQLAKPSAITTAATSSSGATPSLFTPNIFGQAATGAEQGAAKTVSSASSFTFGSQTQTSSFFTSPGGTAFGVKSDSNALTTTTPTTVAQAFSFAQSGTGALTSGLGFIVPGSTGNSAFSVAPGASASTGIFGSLVKDQSAATSTLTPQQQHQQHQQPAATAATSAAKTATSVGTTLPSKPMTGIFGGATLPTQPAGAPPPSAFGASVAGMKPAVFGTATSASTKPIATTTTATTASKPLLFGTATTASTKPTVLPTTAASVTTGPIATLSTTVTSRPTTFGNQPPEVISTKPNSVLPIATTTAPQAAPVKSTASSALPTPAVPAAVSGIAAIIGDEMLRFQRELDELKRKKIDISCLGTEQEKRELLRGKEDLADFHAEITDCVQSQNDDINELKSLTLNAAAQIEEGKVRSLRHSDPHYRQMLRSRSLDSTSSNKLKEIRGLYHYIENSIHDVNVVLDEQWKINQDKLHGCRRLQTPTTDYIFRAVSNNHNLILDQTRCLKELKEQLQRIKIYNTTSKWNGSATQRESELSSLADSLRDTSISIKSPPRSQTTPVSAKRQAQLRDMLSKRQVTPTRSTHPGHFSIISPHYLRTPSTPSEAASTDEISEDDSEHNQRNIGFSSFAYPVPDNTSTPIRIDEPRGKETKPVIVSQRLPAVVIPADTVKTQPITQPMKPAFSVPKTTVTTRPAAPVSMTGTNFTAFQPPQMSLAASGISAMSTPLVKTVPKPPLPVEPASTVPIAGFTHSGGGTVSWGASPDINKSIKPGISPAGLAALNRSASGPVQINEQSVPKTVPPPVVNIKNIDTKKTSANTTIAVVDSTKVNEGTVKVVTEVLAEIAATSGKKRVSATSAQIIPSSAAAPITSTTTGTAPTIVSSTTTTSSGTSAVSFSFVPPKSTTTTFGSRTQLPNPSVSSSTVISGLKTSGSGFTFTPSIGSTSFSFGTTVSSAKQDDKNAKLQKDTIGTSSVEVENITPPKTPPVTAPQNKTATPGAFFFVGQPDSTAGSGIAEVSTTTPAVTAATGSILSGKPVTAFGKPPTATVTTTSSAVTAAPSTNTAVPETVAATPIVVPTQPSSLTARFSPQQPHLLQHQ